MKKISLMGVMFLVLILLGIISASFFTVHEGQRGVYGKQGNVKVLQPGLHFALPWNQPHFVNVNNQFSRFSVALPDHNENLAVAVMWQVKDVPLFVKANTNPNEVLTSLKKTIQTLVTPQMIAKTASSAELAKLINTALATNQTFTAEGISVEQVWVTSVEPNAAEQKQIFSEMKGLAATMGQSVMQNGEAQAEKIRNQAEKSFIQSQSAALADAAKVLGQGNSNAVKVMAPLYRKNPSLFKAYVAEKMKLLTGTQSSSS